MSLLYFDCFSGISGDMIIGALLDLGASFEILQDSLNMLSIPINISYTRKLDRGINSVSFRVATESKSLRRLDHVESLINKSSLDADIKERSLEVFHRMAEAEGIVHGISPKEVHFHEIGAIDTLTDIVGTFICLHNLNVNKVYSSPLPWSRGWADISHGRFPLPAPATIRLMVGFPCVFNDTNLELVTPTGAAIITTIASSTPPPMPFIPTGVGYGAGDLVRADNVPNLLRIIRAKIGLSGYLREEIAVLETEVDDLNPEVFSHLHRMFINDPSVLDYFTTPVNMKKNRPGVLITILCKPESIQSLTSLLIKESGSLGVRYRIQNRVIAYREDRQLETPWGLVKVKVAKLDSGLIRIKPEFEDCQAIALKHALPLLDVLAEINRLANEPQK